MDGLLNKEEVMQFFGLKTVEATERMLKRLGVPKVNYSLAGGKGIRYRKSDLQEAVSKMEVVPKPSQKPRMRRKVHSVLFDMPINDQFKLLTASGPRQ